MCYDVDKRGKILWSIALAKSSSSIKDISR